jgi:hypothetical protein
MAGDVVLPSNLEDTQVLKRFLSDLVFNLNTNPFFAKTGTGELADYIANLNDAAAVNPSFAKAVAKIRELQADVKAYVEQNIETKILQNSEDVALVAEQFGTFYDQALAAAWYGLTVKAGNVISGFTVGSIDTDTTTPGTEGSFFAINTDTFSVAKAIEDISDPAELAYLQANNLPYGTMYNTDTGNIIPAFLVEWNGASYDIFFNGIVNFSNVAGTETLLTNVNDALASIADLEAARDGTVTIFYEISTSIPVGMIYGDYLVDIDSWSGTKYDVYRYEDVDGGSSGALAWRLNTGEVAKTISSAYRADVLADTAQYTADGKMTIWYHSGSEVWNYPNAKTGDLLIQYPNNEPFKALQDAPSLEAHWTSTRDTTNDTALSTALQDIATLQETDDGVVNSFYQTTAPSGQGESYGDWWVDTDAIPMVAYRYEDIDGKNVGALSWVDNSTSILGASYLNAASAQATADGKITTFYQASPPTAEGTGDIWIDTDDHNQPYIWSGTQWVTMQDTTVADNIYVSGTTTINGGRIDTSVIGTGVIYNTGANATNYTMKVDLNNGEIHIR